MSKRPPRRERIQNRAQEWVKKLHPDALRNRLRNFRRYVISATIEKRDSSSTPVATDETSASTAALATQSLRNDCHISTNSTRRNENLDVNRFNIESRKSSHSQNGRGRLTLSMGDARIPDVIVQENSVSSQNCAMESDLSGGAKNNLQLAINVDATPRNKSPITVQEWIDSLPLTSVESSREESEVSDKSAVPLGDCENDNLTLGAEAGYLVDVVDKKRTPTIPPPPVNVTITGPGGQEPSEVESHCSSVDSLLEARKPDPEEVLLSLGFGGTASSSYLETGRIPKRFLQQSQLKGVDIEDFIRQQQDLIYTFESGYYGYRGLAGPSHSNPSVIVAKILEKLREHERETTSMTSYQLDFRKPCSLEKNPDNGAATNKFSKVARNVLTKIRCTPSSVLSPDNRRWLDSQGSKSPEIARRLIIGQKSFTFGRDGDLIEASNLDNIDRCSSFEESYKETSDDETVDTVASRSAQHDQSVEKVDHYADSATESEFASYTHRSLADKTIHRQYEELILLESVLHNLGRPIKIITKEQFSAISSEQRCAVQIQIIREALKAYLNQMTEDEIHSELKNCLSAEVQKVADLLDNSSDASKLAVIVKQMTLLLQHQSQLSAQIKELSVVDKKPTSCHELCDHILKRVHELELLVQQNAQELAQMKYQLLKKDHY
ncbi:uncharacterized protein olf186-M isoform X4 [Planococcus citri]|uniref:uncharacterized protein olf186-M isoform X4 n=1 Tax=Planococcus citri TaxID=170843 RepID=UPI0031F7EBDD